MHSPPLQTNPIPAAPSPLHSYLGGGGIAPHTSDTSDMVVCYAENFSPPLDFSGDKDTHPAAQRVSAEYE
jgi:hypothetical protein